MKTLMVKWVRFDHFCSLFFLWTVDCLYEIAKVRMTVNLVALCIVFLSSISQKFLCCLNQELIVLRQIGLLRGWVLIVVIILKLKDSLGVIWVLWKEVVGISILRNDSQFVHMLVSTPNCNNFLFTVMYGSPNFKGRQPLWSNLRSLESDNFVPWIVAGDFNAFLTRDEKKRGWNRGSVPCRKFNEWVRECSMVDLGFYGPKFTWHRGMVF